MRNEINDTIGTYKIKNKEHMNGIKDLERKWKKAVKKKRKVERIERFNRRKNIRKRRKISVKSSSRSSSALKMWSAICSTEIFKLSVYHHTFSRTRN